MGHRHLGLPNRGCRTHGRGRSIWDAFAHIPGKTRNGDDGDVACDHDHKSRTDGALMKDMGIRCYRFFFFWSRLIPMGRGAVNEAGVTFYNELIDGLLEAGIQPWVTLIFASGERVPKSSARWHRKVCRNNGF